MIRKAGLSKVKLQSYILLPSNDEYLSIKEGSHSVISKQGSHKEVVFDFDGCFLLTNEQLKDVEDPHHIPDEVLPYINHAVDMLWMGYQATILLYLAPMIEKKYSDRNLHLLSESIVKHLYGYIQPKAQENNNNNQYQVEIGSYELIDNQLRDLLLSESAEITSIKMREQNDGNVLIDGLTFLPCPTVEHMMDIIHRALARRIIAVGGSLEATSKLSSGKITSEVLANMTSKVFGPIGNMVLQVKLTRILHFTHGNVDNAVSSESIMNIVFMATADSILQSIEFKGFKSFPETRHLEKKSLEWIIPDDQLSKTTQMRNCMKSLATFSRVINSLVEKASNGPHVPFRDSLLTRLLRPSLEGNCFLSMLTLPPKHPESASRALRFASQIGKLFNMIWINEEISLRQVPVAFVSNTDAANDLTKANNRELLTDDSKEKQDDSEALSENVHRFNSRFQDMQDDMNMLSSDLDALEQMREAFLLRLGMDIKPVKQYHSLAYNQFNLIGTDEKLAIDSLTSNVEEKRATIDDIVDQDVDLDGMIVAQEDSFGEGFADNTHAEKIKRKVNQTALKSLDDDSIPQRGSKLQKSLKPLSSIGSNLLKEGSKSDKNNKKETSLSSIGERPSTTSTVKARALEQSVGSAKGGVASSRSLKPLQSLPESKSGNLSKENSVKLQPDNTLEVNRLMSPSSTLLNSNGGNKLSGRSSSEKLRTANVTKLPALGSSPIGNAYSSMPTSSSGKLGSSSSQKALNDNGKSMKTKQVDSGNISDKCSENSETEAIVKTLRKNLFRDDEKDEISSVSNRSSPDSNLDTSTVSDTLPSKRPMPPSLLKSEELSELLEPILQSDVTSEDVSLNSGKANRQLEPPASSNLLNSTNNSREASSKMGNKNDLSAIKLPKVQAEKTNISSTPASSKVSTAATSSERNRQTGQQNGSKLKARTDAKKSSSLIKGARGIQTTSDTQGKAYNRVGGSGDITYGNNEVSNLDSGHLQSGESVNEGDGNAADFENEELDGQGGSDGNEDEEGILSGSSLPPLASPNKSSTSTDAMKNYKSFRDYSFRSRSNHAEKSELEPLQLGHAEKVHRTKQSPEGKQDGFSQSMQSSSLLMKKKSRQENAQEFASDEDDGLTDQERKFLRRVATGNEAGALDSLEEDGVNVHVKNTFERDAMQIAARNGNLSMLKMLYMHGGSLNSKGLRGDNLFHLAGYYGHVDTMRWLQRQGINPDMVDMYGQNIVHIAARRGELAVLKYLWEDLGMTQQFILPDVDGRNPMECIPRRGPPELEYCREYMQDIYSELMPNYDS